MAQYRQRCEKFTELLAREVVDIDELRKLVFEGCPNETLRSCCWKLLLDYLPCKRVEWPSHILERRSTYRQLVKEMIVRPSQKTYKSNRADVTSEDHPLNPDPDSEWSAYFKDNEMLLQIDKDCRRLYPDLSFFQNATTSPMMHGLCNNQSETLRKRVERTVLKAQNVFRNCFGTTSTQVQPKKQQTDEYITLADNEEAHWEVVERVLFLYAKLNPGQGYVQGMNEIIGPIYFSFAKDTDKSFRENAEADTFWCFTNLMSEIRDNFIKSLDDSSCGIGELMSRLFSTLKLKDITLWLALRDQNLEPQYFAFRWLTLLLSQEFQLPDVLRIWDSLLSDKKPFDFLISIGCAMLMLVREEILRGDFSANMKLLQNYPIKDVHFILAKAVELS